MTPERQAIETALDLLANTHHHTWLDVSAHIHGVIMLSAPLGIYSNDLHHIYQTAANLAREELRRAA